MVAMDHGEDPSDVADFYVVELAVGCKIIVKKGWVQEPEENKTKIFYSPNFFDRPKFENAALHFFKENEKACYYGRVCTSCGEQ